MGFPPPDGTDGEGQAGRRGSKELEPTGAEAVPTHKPRTSKTVKILRFIVDSSRYETG
jgi:hypothetical protein